jgi:CDP-6-deoxy-D-xylo-4-hexulose-3-dehydrase
MVDNCESIGARTHGRLAGTQGLVNTFSFYWSHQLSAIEGGMVLTDDDKLARVCRLLRNHGWNRSHETFENEYRFDIMGYNLRPLEMHAAIAREQLRKLDGAIKERTRNFDYFLLSARFHDLPLTFPVIHGKPSYFGIHFTLPSSEARARVVTALRSNGIDCRPPCAGSLRKQPYGKRWVDHATPNADRIHDTGIMLGNPPYPIEPLIDRAVSVMREVL